MDILGKPLTSENHAPSSKIVFLVLLSLHTALLIASNAAGAKLVRLPGGLAASATVYSYAISYIVLAAVAELYGKATSRTVVNLGLFAVAVSVCFLELAIVMPAADGWQNQEAFVTVLGSSFRILLGGWTAYYFSQHLDISSFFYVRSLSFGVERLWLRAWIGTAIGQFFDTVIFICIAFYGSHSLLPLIVGQYITKLIFATIMTPLLCLAIPLLRRIGGSHVE